jgi:hypothetical protein
MDRPGFFQAFLVFRLFLSMAAITTAAGLVLTSAFFPNVKYTVLKGFFVGPIPGGTIARKESLVAAEILIGVLIVVWVLTRTMHLARGLSSLESADSFPSYWPVMAIAFWGAIATVASRFHWNEALRRSLVALFVGLVLFSIAAPLYYFIAWPTDVIGGVLLGTAVLCLLQFVLERLNLRLHDDFAA